MTTKTKTEKYIEAVGRRKTAIARVRIAPASKNSYKINDRDLADFFPTAEMQRIVEGAVSKIKGVHFHITAQIKGGGIHSQAEAMRHGLARALVLHDSTAKSILKPIGFLKRDPRAKERRKFGLKKARKAPQWSKR